MIGTGTPNSKSRIDRMGNSVEVASRKNDPPPQRFHCRQLAATASSAVSGPAPRPTIAARNITTAV